MKAVANSTTGLRMIPSLIPPTIQSKLLSLMLHRDLSDPSHQTNLHLHYDIQYPNVSNHGSGTDDTKDTPQSYASFFEADPSLNLTAKDPNIHKAITVQNMLDKKLRWVTLGGQYNWTTKVYPDGPPPAFPADIARLLGAAFPETDAQAAIVNFYSANDTLSMHRDVSEKCDVGLISVSIGCDGLFMISHDDGEGCEVIRLRSGDAVYMSGRSRFAWHGVPKIIPETCPAWLRDWPGPEYPYWQGWMSGKRINLNVRQMTDAKPNQDAALAL
jgi:DNA alkylation damage repair protein AlkB